MSHKSSQNFSFTWKIDNFPSCYQRNSDPILSPSFVAECLGGSLWYLELYPKGIDEENVDYISCFLARDDCCSFNGIITVDFTLQIIGGNGEVIETFEGKSTKFDKHDSHGSEKLVKFNEIINKLKERNEDTLTIRSKISHGTEMKMATACVAHSEVSIDKHNFKWNVNYDVHVSNLPRQERNFNLGELQLKIIFSVQSYQLVFDITLMECTKPLPCVLACQISFLNHKGVPDAAFNETHLFQSRNEIWELPIFMKSDQLRNCKDIFMTVERLPMVFDFSSSNEVVSEATPISYTYDTSYDANSLTFLQSDFRELFVSKKHTDVIFRVDNQELKVHKTVMIARSPVFSTMFDQDMTENQTGIVVITDADVETLQSFLEYLYTGAVEILNYEKAIKLITVAEKYQVQSLIDECYAFLLTVLSQKNVCELIYVADIVNHTSLKTAAMDYIASHTKEILSSPEWSEWSEKNLKLTSDIFTHIASNCDITLKRSAS